MDEEKTCGSQACGFVENKKNHVENSRKNHCCEEALPKEAKVLYMMPNFAETPSEQESFYDCVSEGDIAFEEISDGLLEDTDCIRAALQRAADTTQMLLQNLSNGSENAGPKSANLEITARLISSSGSQSDNINVQPYRVRIEPITFRIPIKFDMSSQPPCISAPPCMYTCLTGVSPTSKHGPPPPPEDDFEDYEPPCSAAICDRSDRPKQELKHVCGAQEPCTSKRMLDLETKKSQTDASFIREKLKAQGKHIIESDDDMATFSKRSQTDASYLRDKKRDPKNENRGKVSEKVIIKEPEEPTHSDEKLIKTKLYASDDNGKPSQTDASYLRDKYQAAPTTDEEIQASPVALSSDREIEVNESSEGVTKPADVTDERIPLKSDKIDYPTQYRKNETDDKPTTEDLVHNVDNTLPSDENVTCPCKARLSVDKSKKEVDNTGDVYPCKCAKIKEANVPNSLPKYTTEICMCKKKKLSSEEEIEKEQTSQKYPCKCIKTPPHPQTYTKFTNTKEVCDLSENVKNSQDICCKGENLPVAPDPTCVCKKHNKTLFQTETTEDEISDPRFSINFCEADDAPCKAESGRSIRVIPPTGNVCTKRQVSQPTSASCICKKGKTSTTSDIIVMSAKDIKTRGGFEKKTKDAVPTLSWYAYEPSCSATSKESKKKLPKSGECVKCSGNDDGRYFSCDSTSESSIVCKCFPEKSHKTEHIPPCDYCIVGNKSGSEEDENELEGLEEEAGEGELTNCFCSTQTITCAEDPEASCRSVKSRKEKIMTLLDDLTDVANAEGSFVAERQIIIQNLFKEITVLLCKDIYGEDSQKQPKKTNKIDEGTSDQESENEPPPHEPKVHKPNPKLEKCFAKLEEMIQECFGSKKKELPVMEIYNVELDPDFDLNQISPAFYDEEVWPEDDFSEENKSQRDEEGEFGVESGVEESKRVDGVAGTNSETEAFQGELEDCECVNDVEVVLMEEECKVCEETGDGNICAGICEEYHGSECNCCHCRAMREDECKTVKKPLDSAMCDPVCEMKYFIDSIIFDLDAMEHVLHSRDLKPKPEKSKPFRPPCDSFPVCIMDVTTLGTSSLFVRWEILDCCGIAGYEIYVDGHLTNRYYSPNHESAVICDINIDNIHQIVLRAHPIGEDFPGDSCPCVKVPAKQQPGCSPTPWTPSIFLYDPLTLE